ncbi:4-oxalocrotonate tautomerase family protein [Bradyrhizobium sp. CCGUVB1N3]|uniref:tautomerase family protein n=1 Tax=Bradyrhizobium sp. CCGUVB1N3 TaxID=2949629 RepID=UPI0020B434D3|nr:4-oxalocrotonate tautomerase family protein [Bradyrhizobium sp. CCGUVB1N3]MCP3469406.1 4-oxalocrotonate tautomerase family protein [Bradyrhizobium sp. CCGUVB1N3]
MPFANIKIPQAALSQTQKAEIVHRLTALFVDYFGEAARPHTMVLIEEVPDGGYGHADEVFVIPEAHRASDGGAVVTPPSG